jgi:hypothetical protein
MIARAELTVSAVPLRRTLIQLFMETFESAVLELQGILATSPLAGLSDSLAARPLSTGQWSPKQILGHLLDSAANNHHRFVRAQIEGELSMPAYAQREWVDTQHYQDRPWTALIALWTAYNHHLLWVMEQTPAAKRSNLCHIGKDDPVTLEFLMIDYVRHLKHHLDQMKTFAAASQ